MQPVQIDASDAIVRRRTKVARIPLKKERLSFDRSDDEKQVYRADAGNAFGGGDSPWYSMNDRIRAIGIVADLTVRVPRDGDSDLHAGVRTALQRIDPIEEVEAVTVTGVTPRLNAVRTDVTARLTVPIVRPTAECAAMALESGFAIEPNAVRLQRPFLEDSSTRESP